jgi:hypothetical protein
MTRLQAIIPIERIASRIYLIRGQKVMLDQDLADLYQVETRVLVQAVKRNKERFPQDFAFQLSRQQFQHLRSQTVMSSWGGRRHPPYAFTEHGVTMLSSVLRSKRAIQVNVAIVRAFVRLRQILASDQDLARKVEEHDRQIAVLFDTVQKLLAPPPLPKKHPIGYVTPKD